MIRIFCVSGHFLDQVQGFSTDKDEPVAKETHERAKILAREWKERCDNFCDGGRDCVREKTR